MDKITQQIYNEILIKIKDNSLHLASLPDLIIKVNSVLADDNKSLNDIAKVIHHEVALSTRIIRIANSPGLRGDKEVNSMVDAINRLGVTLVKNLAIVVSLNDKFTTSNMNHTTLMQEITKNSVDSGAYGFLIVRYLVSNLSPDLALLNGLISRVGHMVILRYLNDVAEYRKLSLKDTCNVIIDIHDKVGSTLLTNWEFPTACLTALFSHSTANTSNPSTYRDVFVITQKYIAYKENPDPKNFLKVFDDIYSVITEHKEEFESLRSIIS